MGDLSSPSIDILKQVTPLEDLSITREMSEPAVTPNNRFEDEPPKPAFGEVVDMGRDPDKKPKNSSDIFSLKENKNLPLTVFSVKGAPAKTIYRTMSTGSNNPSTPHIATPTLACQYRNPLTGVGVTSSDEFKNEPSKRKDGNPLLGLGYKEPENKETNQKIPPGGHSTGLW